jgi:hypothetical protein
MRAGTRENESGIGGDGSAREDRLYSERGRSEPVSWDAADAESKTIGSSSSGSNERGRSVSEAPWFTPVEESECKDGVCPVPWLTKPIIQEDVVNHPSHYTEGGVECIEAIEAQLSHEEYRGYLKGCIAKYVWRERHKGGLESLKKARWYLERLIELEEPG